MFASDLEVCAHKPGEWVLTKPLRWQQGAVEIVVPRGFITDLASIPRLLRPFFDINGRSRRAAVLHDWGYCAQWADRDEIDALFMSALIAEGMSAPVARIYWTGVRLGGWYSWRKRARQPLRFLGNRQSL